MNLKYIDILLKLTDKAMSEDETPVAALIVYKNKIIAKSYNTRNGSNRTTDHAEIKVITKANKKLKSWRLNNCTLYVTLEPCEMCKGVIRESRIENVYYLISRDTVKKQYGKTTFEQLSLPDLANQKMNLHRKKIEKYWKNKR